ncbi:PREDICTED: O-acetyl-ADP-ribose deacetylase MACROD2 [Odobenus rosmarus divergens]|uniref:O-acetyl-ADP-ribose deacetylase MACROD2 n=1 Tax=Odobenus rosmarus divergens TaxID=9708 RepID=A0A2U3WU42_ODORO|nr:PREDICTED: O-acetyl-ADP-ribose deacetylase MACROD2 [Odobenus rosmarus divergens]
MYPSNKKKKVWREEKERLLKMTLEERRKEYVRDYVPLNTILSWKEEMKGKSQNDEENTQETSQVKKSLSEKVSLYRGDITLLEVDAIVNAEVQDSCKVQHCLKVPFGDEKIHTHAFVGEQKGLLENWNINIA